MRSLLRFLIVLIGAITGVSLPTSCAYGTEKPAIFSTIGTVKNDQQKPIPYIHVQIGVGTDEQPEPTMPDGYYETSEAGRFTIFVYSEQFTGRALNFRLVFTDADGTANGGEYLPVTVNIPVTDVKDGKNDFDVVMNLKAR